MNSFEYEVFERLAIMAESIGDKKALEYIAGRYGKTVAEYIWGKYGEKAGNNENPKRGKK